MRAEVNLIYPLAQPCAALPLRHLHLALRVPELVLRAELPRLTFRTPVGDGDGIFSTTNEFIGYMAPSSNNVPVTPWFYDLFNTAGVMRILSRLVTEVNSTEDVLDLAVLSLAR